MPKNTINIKELAETALSAISDTKYNCIHIFLDGLKKQTDEADAAIITYKDSQIGPSEELHA